MSDVTMSTAASSTALSAPSAQQNSAAVTHSDFASDKELMLAAIARMEAAVLNERASHDRLRTELSSMAEALAHAKKSVKNAATTGKPVNVSVLLTWLEARVHSMRVIIDPPAAIQQAEPAPVIETTSAPVTEALAAETSETEAVPTVSDVVSRLGRASDALAAEVASLEQTVATAQDVPTPAMLGAMVEALTAPEAAAPEIAKAEPGEAIALEAPVDETVGEMAKAPAEVIEPEDVEFELAPELYIPETQAAQPAAEDATPETTAFAAELGASGTSSAEAEEILAEPEIADTEAALEVAVVEQDVVIVETAPEKIETAADSLNLEVAGTTLIEAESAAEPVSTVETEAPAASETAEAEAIAIPEPANTVEAEAVEAETVAEASTETPATVTVATSRYETSLQESDLLSSFAAMEAMPFMHDDVGTAVIFEARADFDPVAEQTAFETPVKPEATAAEQKPVTNEPEAATEAAEIVAYEPKTAIEETEAAESGIAAIEPDTSAKTESVADLETVVAVEAAEPETRTPADAIAAEAPAVEVRPADIHAEAAWQQAEPAAAATSYEVPATVASGKLAAYAGMSTLWMSLASHTEAKSEAAFGTTQLVTPAESEQDVAQAESTASIEASASEQTEAKIEAAAAQAIAEAAIEVELSDPQPAEAKAAGAHTAETPTPVVASEPVAISPAKTEAAISPRTGSVHLGAAEAALAQARAELAAAAALLNTGRPKIVEARPAPVVEKTTATEANSGDDDLEDLFEPEPDAALDPNAVLLDSVPAPAFTLHPATAAVLPMHDMALAPAAKAAAPKAVSPVEKPARPEAVTAPAPIDPLAPLKAMSDEEKIALFS